MNDNEPWFIGQRAELLAAVTFTRLPGVMVRQQPAESGLDLLVTLPADRGGRVFGVEVMGARHRDSYFTPDGHMHAEVVQRVEKQAGDSPFPVGIAVFDVSDDSGFFGWLLAPTESDAGDPKLERRQSVVVMPITTGELNRIVHDVNHWYDLRTVPAV